MRGCGTPLRRGSPVRAGIDPSAALLLELSWGSPVRAGIDVIAAGSRAGMSSKQVPPYARG